MLNDEEFEHLKELLADMTDWQLISVHSYLRLEETKDTVNINEIFYADDFNFDIKTNQLLAYIEIEYQHRNLN